MLSVSPVRWSAKLFIVARKKIKDYLIDYHLLFLWAMSAQSFPDFSGLRDSLDHPFELRFALGTLLCLLEVEVEESQNSLYELHPIISHIDHR